METKTFNYRLHFKRSRILLFLIVLITYAPATFAQAKDAVVEAMVKEATENSQLEKMAHELVDVIGPRLVGTPQMQQAHDWAVQKFNSWG
ncbi:MAG: hypothetical protein ACO1NX_02355, partial [Chitinophagaceae bacterium]